MAIYEINLRHARVMVGPRREPVAAFHDQSVSWEHLDFAPLRRPLWLTCEWCGLEPRREERCYRCNHLHGMAMSPVQWRIEHPLDSIWWNDWRREMVAQAFAGDVVR